MTLGTFMPLASLLGLLVIVPSMLAQLRALPGSTDPGYDEQAVGAKRRAIRIILAAWLASPVIFYVVFNIISPADGAMVLW